MASASRAQHPPVHPVLSSKLLGCLLATWLIWGSTYLAIRFALVSLPPFFQMGSRFVVAGGLLLIYTRYAREPWPTLEQWRNALIVGGLMLGCGMGLTAYAEQTVASGLVVVFIAVVPALTTMFGLPFGIRPSRIEVAGIAVALIGVLWLSRGNGFGGSLPGLLAMGAATCGWSLGSVLSQQRLPLAPGASGYCSEMICGGVLLLVTSAVTHEQVIWPPQPLAVAAWLYLVVFGSLIAFTAYMTLLGQARLAVSTSYCFVNPVVALLLGVTLGKESVAAHEWYAAAVVLLGVIILLLGKQARTLGSDPR